MTIILDPELEARLAAAAARQGTTAEALAMETLRERFPKQRSPIEPQDEWERRLRAIATDCGVSLSDEALSRESLYE